jgi:hypothetical protein
MDDDMVIKESLRLEKLYEKTMSLIMSEDRALGRGYLFNVMAAPFVKRAIWSHEKKLKEIVSKILRNEIICKDCDLVLKVNSDSIIKMILDKNKGTILNLLSIKFGDRIFWCDDPYLSGTNLKKNIYNLLNDNTKNYVNHIEKPIDYKIDSRSNEKNVTVKYTFFYTIKRVLMTIINELKVTVRRNRKKDSYIMFGWIPVILRNFFNYNYVKKLA